MLSFIISINWDVYSIAVFRTAVLLWLMEMTIKLTTAAALREQDYENLTAEAAQGWNISRGMGMSLVGA